MSGDWIKMRSNLWDDPRITGICDKTGQAEATIVGACYWLWATADQHSVNGTLPGVTLASIDRKTGVKGFGQALVDACWLAECDEGVQLMRFEDHNGTSAKKRAVTAKRVAGHRSGDNIPPHPESRNAHVTQETENGNASVTQAALQNEYKNVTPALAREREEKEKRTTPSSSDDDSMACPIGSLVNLYHECMPMNPQVKVLNETRKRAIRQRWKEASAMDCKPFGYSTRADGLEAWRQFFEVCAQSDFLTGRAPGMPGKPPFVADIDFLFSPSGFARTLENKYHRDAA